MLLDELGTLDTRRQALAGFCFAGKQKPAHGRVGAIAYEAARDAAQVAILARLDGGSR